MSLEDLYRAVIMDHYQHPRNKGKLESGAAAAGEGSSGGDHGDHANGSGNGGSAADATGVRVVQLTNPTCGDEIELALLVEDGLIKDVRFLGHGCSISMASASMMTEAIKGKSTAEAMGLLDDFKCMVKGRECDQSHLGDLEALAGVAKFPARFKCATLAWNALARGIAGGAKSPEGGDESGHDSDRESANSGGGPA